MDEYRLYLSRRAPKSKNESHFFGILEAQRLDVIFSRPRRRATELALLDGLPLGISGGRSQSFHLAMTRLGY